MRRYYYYYNYYKAILKTREHICNVRHYEYSIILFFFNDRALLWPHYRSIQQDNMEAIILLVFFIYKIPCCVDTIARKKNDHM